MSTESYTDVGQQRQRHSTIFLLPQGQPDVNLLDATGMAVLSLIATALMERASLLAWYAADGRWIGPGTARVNMPMSKMRRKKNV
jgi:hypothetical protein